MAAESKRRGSAGEDFAAAQLEKEGWQLIARNFHSREGEIDLVARHGAVLAFVEVKARSGNGYGIPAEAVGIQKRRRIVLCAQQFLLEHPEYETLELRFDIAEVWLRAGLPVGIRLLPGAFTLDDL